jgi:uncharacterized repeat protein (TIGR01451 family)
MTNLFFHACKGVASTFLVVFLLLSAQSAVAEGISLNQCANGGIKEAVDHLQCYDGWINGNLNQSKAAYAEGNFVPYRARLTGLTAGEKYTYSFSWDILKSGQHAIDYIGTFDHSVTGADACSSALSPCPVTVDMIAIPPDPAVTAAFTTFHGIPAEQLPGYFTLFGGSFDADAVGSYMNISADVQGISVDFTPDQSSVVLAWGGHISSPFDWGEGATASGIHGSPYHVSNIALKDASGDVVASGGQDVQLSAAAVFRPSTIRVTKTANKYGTFSFESMQGATPIPPVGMTNPWSLTTGEFEDISAPTEGNVTITESLLPAGPWRLKSIVCSKLNDGVVFEYEAGSDSLTDTAEFDVGEGESYSCTFDNEFFGAPVLKVIKKVIAHDAICTDDVRDSSAHETLSIHSGEDVRYCYWVTNTGDDPALDIALLDDLGDEHGILAIVSLTGGSDLDAQADAPDLGVGEWLFGEMVVAINVALNTTVTNIATASGTGQFDGQPYSDNDDANVTTDKSSSCTLVASVYTGAGSCAAGSPQFDVLAGSTVNWCGIATWDSGAVLDFSGIQVDMLASPLSYNTELDMSPAEMRDISVGSKAANSDMNGIVMLTGKEGGLNPISCQGQATVNVVTPGIKITKTISLDDSCSADDSNQATIINGDPVWYCLEVENTGDVRLTQDLLNDSHIDVLNEGGDGLAVGEMKTYTFGPFYPSEGYTNTATTRAIEPMTDSPVGPESSSATLTVLSADVSLDKSVDPGSIVICGPDSQVPAEFCSKPNLNDLFDATYTIKVTNHGPNEASAVYVSDTLPAGFFYDHYAPVSITCNDINLPAFDCNIGDMNPGTSVTITVYGEIDPDVFDLPWVTIDNQACANTTPPELDPDHSNNCDDAKTKLGTGATRTIGWWSTHPDGLQACLDASSDEIELGFLTIRTEGADGEVDATVSTDQDAKGKHKSSLMTAMVMDDDDTDPSEAIVMAKGMMNANVAHWGDGTQRSHIGQARVKAAKQLTAAWCNETMFGSVFGNILGGWDTVYLIMAGQAYMDGDTFMDCGGECSKTKLNAVIQSINLVGGAADLFNNSGDDLDIPFPPGPADPHAVENDPTDPFD